MDKPKLSWAPLRWLPSMLSEGQPTFEHWFCRARQLGLGFVEIYYALIDPPTEERAAEIRDLLSRYELGVSQLCCASDFTHPDPAVREAELEKMQRFVDLAAVLGAAGVRVTAGCRHEGVSREQGVRWASEYLLRLAEYAQPRGVRLGFENHFRDRLWHAEDFALHAVVYLDIFRRVEHSWVGVNFDSGNQLMTGEDPMVVLRAVKHKVWHMHASDRLPGQYQHSVVGEGAVDFDPIFRCLAEIGYSGFISHEDSNPEGDAGTERSLAFLRRKIAQFWG